MVGGARTSTGSRPGVAGERWRVERHASLDSTNRYVRDQARAGAAPGLVVVADHQRAGRGRLGRRWEAPPGSSLLVSVLLRVPGEGTAGPGGGVRAVAAVSVALAEAVGSVAGVDVGLKWPNDLVVDDRKLAGILAETDEGGDLVVVGAGCNVNWEAFGPELAGTATACNLEAGGYVDREALLDVFLERLGARLDAPEELDAAYRARLVTLGRRVRVERAGDGVVGEGSARADHGALLVRGDDGVVHRIAFGDVVHLRDT